MSTTGVGDAWVGNELNTVRKAGVPFVLHALRAPTRKLFASEWASELNRDTRVIYPVPVAGLIASILSAPFLFGRRYFAALLNALFGRRESLRCRLAGLSHFLVACHWARSLRHEPPAHVHSQWIHSGGSIAYYGSWLLNVPFSFTGHAADIFRDRCALLDKIQRAEFIVCISEFHRDFFLKHGARPEQLIIAYCGIDLKLFAPPRREPRGPGEKLHIRSSGRLVEKKGFTYLIDACKLLKDRGVQFDCVIAGSGPLQAALQSQIDLLGLAGDVKLTGQEIKQEEIPEFTRGGDVYALPCVWASDNDVDGLPQMLMECLACGLPVISTRLVGIPDLIIDGKTGLLVEPNNPVQLADAITRMRDDPALRVTLAQQGRAYLCEKFDLNTSLEPLIQRYRERLKAAESRKPARGPSPAAADHSPDAPAVPQLQEQTR